MSKVTINGIIVMSTPDHQPTPRTVVSTQPSFATHRLVDGNWVLKGTVVSHQPTPAPRAPIGFTLPTPPATPVVPTSAPVSYLGSRKEYLRAIEVAAGKVLTLGVDQEAIDMLRRGRMGGRKDNMGDLHGLLMRYTTGRYA